MTLRSGAVIPQLTPEEAAQKSLLSRDDLTKMHLMPKGDPVAYAENADTSIQYFFDPVRVIEAPPEVWYDEKPKNVETMTLDNGAVIEKMSIKRAALFGYYTKERLDQMHYDVVEEPVAYTKKNNGDVVWLYDKLTAVRQPQMCVKCGQNVRFRHKLCEACFEEEMAVRRAEGNEHRNAYYHMNRERVIFFDLELTGVHDHDEIISVSITDANEKLLMNTLVKPVHTKKWKRTEKIHGITPEMVQDAPYLTDIIPEIKRIFADADNLIAFGVSTDYSHIKYIYDTNEEREALREKTRCCANEYVRYMHECRPDLTHGSLIDAMDCFQISWDGIPHNSLADTISCARVWDKLFPNYYDN